MIIDDSGNVGIGTATPSTGFNTNRNNLVISDASAAGLTINSTATDGSSIISMTDGTGTLAGEIHYVHDGNSMRFNTDGSERMRINSSGHVSIGYAGSVTRFYAYGNTAGEYVGYFQHDGNNNDRYGVRIVAGTDDASGVIYHIRCDDGDGHVLGYLQHESGTLAIQQASDERLKENIVDSTLEGINTLKNIKQREFNLKRDTSKTKIVGYVAQEMESVYPAAISEMDATQDGSAPEDDPENPYKTLSKTALIDVLIKAMQEQQVIIEDLKTRITTLEGS